jgi:phosphoadenosine phosphosulfate reductase
MLKEKTLFGEWDKIQIAIARIKEFEPMALINNPAGYYVCVSGGKDSTVIQELCIMAGIKCEFVHNHTSVDHPETVYFIRREQKRIQKIGYIFRIEVPRFADGRQKTMWNLIPKRGLPTRIQRWCCVELKEYGGSGRYCVTGVRWEESVARKNNRGLHEDDRVILNNDNDMRRRLNESCIPKRKFILNPIIDWAEDDVWEFIKINKLPYNPLYDLGWKRIGCVGCPMGDNREELKNNPKFAELYLRAAENHIEYRKTRGLDLNGPMGSGQKYFKWWLGK